MSYQGIARKYRPQTFDDVVGQRTVTNTLRNAIERDRVAHGYIFSGARGVGKTTSARILAKALNCVNGPTASPCGVCDSCRDIAAGNSVDVIEIDAASNRGIDEIRELRETARYLPARDRYKVFIIDEAHMLTTEAFNALLKTLEEPPPRCLFILATTEAHKLPTTIQSRCQHFAFRLLDYAEVMGRLKEVCVAENIQTDEGALAVLAEAAEGSMRDGLSLLDQVIAGSAEGLTESEVQRLLGIVPGRFLEETVEAVIAADAARVLDQVQRLAGEGLDPSAFVGELTRFIRALMIARTAGVDSPLLEVASDRRATLARLAVELTDADWLRFFQILLRTQNDLRYSLQPRFHLELGLLKMVHARRLVSLEDVLAGLGYVKGESSGPQAPSRAPERTPAARTAAPVASAPASPGPSSTPARPAPSPARSNEPPPWETRTSQSSGAPSAPRAAPPVPARPPAPQAAPSPRPAPPAAAPDSSEFAGRPGEDARLAEIRKVLFEQSARMVSSCLEHVGAFRVADGVAHFEITRQNSGSLWVDLLNGREHREALEKACARVLGQPVSVRVTLQEGDGPSTPNVPDARDRARSDERVKAFEQRFDCVWLDFEDLRGNKP